jgi:hypothetical protein
MDQGGPDPLSLPFRPHGDRPQAVGPICEMESFSINNTPAPSAGGQGVMRADLRYHPAPERNHFQMSQQRETKRMNSIEYAPTLPNKSARFPK